MTKYMNSLQYHEISREEFNENIDCSECFENDLHTVIREQYEDLEPWEGYIWNILLFGLLFTILFTANSIMKFTIMGLTYLLFHIGRAIVFKIIYSKWKILVPVEDTCLICYEQSTEQVYKYCNCSAAIHRSCLLTWNKQVTGWNCPQCRKLLIPVSTTFRKDYLIIMAFVLLMWSV